jgi:hypothetical protein
LAILVNALIEEPAVLYSALLADATFHEQLLAFDKDIANTASDAKCCRCGGALHSGNFPRKPRGGPRLGPEHNLRFSFSCAVDGCRSRKTPPSLRFLGRTVYLSVAVALISMMRHGITDARMARLTREIGVDRRTVARWRLWWRERFTKSPFWQIKRAGFSPPVDEKQLPGAILERFVGSTAAGRMIALLRFLAPVTGGEST